MSSHQSPLQPWHIYTALALLSSIAGATPLVVVFGALAIFTAFIRLTEI